MNCKRIILAILTALPLASWSQHLEIGAHIGASNYWGDLAPSVVWKESHLAGGIFARINLSSTFAFTMARNAMTISGNDKNFDYLKPRNINFTCPIVEYSGTLEFNFFKFGVDVLDKKFSPYVFIGIAFTQFDPTADALGQKISLRNVQTEGKSYPGTVTSMPFGLGFKYQFHRHFATEINVNFRRVNSDYLDDVSTVYPDYNATLAKKSAMGAYVADPSSGVVGSTPLFNLGDKRGNSDYTDWYVSSTISVSYRFYKRSKCRRFY